MKNQVSLINVGILDDDSGGQNSKLYIVVYLKARLKAIHHVNLTI